MTAQEIKSDFDSKLMERMEIGKYPNSNEQSFVDGTKFAQEYYEPIVLKLMGERVCPKEKCGRWKNGCQYLGSCPRNPNCIDQYQPNQPTKQKEEDEVDDLR
jgi:hypothetical protein